MHLSISKILRYLVRQDSAASSLFFVIYKGLKKSRRNHKILPLSWMDQAATYDQGLLKKGESIVSTGPYYVNQGATQKEINAPDIFYRAFKNARVSAISSSIILNDQTCLIEQFIDIDQGDFDLSGGQLVMHGKKTALVKLGTAKHIDKGIFLGGNGSYNYYHWLIEIVPKLELLDRLPERTRKFPLLVNEAAEKIHTFREILEKFAPNRDIIYLSSTASYLVDELVNIDTPNNIPFNLQEGERFDSSQSIIRQWTIDYLRRIALQPSTLTHADTSYPKKIFLSRKKGIRNYNQQEVENCLTKHGFLSIFMEELTFDQQVATINNADWIAGPTGAAWTNLVFCRAGTKCLCWMAEEYGDFSAFSNIAAAVNADLQYITYRTGADSTHKLHKMNYVMDVDQIEDVLSQQLTDK